MFSATLQFKLIELGGPGFSLGDQDIFTDDLFSKKNGPRVGFDGGVCVVIRVEDAATFTGTLQCHVTYFLPGGQITTESLVPVAHLRYSGSHNEAITGGTGQYRQARGQTTVTFLTNTAADVRFTVTS